MQEVFKVEIDDFRALRSDDTASSEWFLSLLTVLAPPHELDKFFMAENLVQIKILDLVLDLALSCMDF